MLHSLAETLVTLPIIQLTLLGAVSSSFTSCTIKQLAAFHFFVAFITGADLDNAFELSFQILETVAGEMLC